MTWLIATLLTALAFGGLALLSGQIRRLRHTSEQAAALIDRALAGDATRGEWEAFLGVRQLDEHVEAARLDCAEIVDRHTSAASPPLGISPAGAGLLREVADALRRPGDYEPPERPAAALGGRPGAG